MDNKTYLKEIAKHAQRNTVNLKEDKLNQKKIHISMRKENKIDDFDSLLEHFDLNSLELYRQMMVDRYGVKKNEEE
tara:strand:+ start:350 stop:577 length:228 start_codon:yes stop_codon:yes gene_type:complete